MTEKSQQRSSYWDNIKGILILLTVFAHILFQLQNKAEKTALNDEYSVALENYCKNNNLGFINTNNYIKSCNVF